MLVGSIHGVSISAHAVAGGRAGSKTSGAVHDFLANNPYATGAKQRGKTPGGPLILGTSDEDSRIEGQLHQAAASGYSWGDHESKPGMFGPVGPIPMMAIGAALAVAGLVTARRFPRKPQR